jgi:hypothetical protein
MITAGGKDPGLHTTQRLYFKRRPCRAIFTWARSEALALLATVVLSSLERRAGLQAIDQDAGAGAAAGRRPANVAARILGLRED